MNKEDFYVIRMAIPSNKTSRLYAYKVHGNVYPRKGYGVFELGTTKFITHLESGYILGEAQTYADAEDMIRLKSPAWNAKMEAKIKSCASNPKKCITRAVKAIRIARQEEAG